ncbi:hypothetical protein BC828DRAFT_437060 [Blastocladiella britannica]|nr:hypothetical protein BC828DRAFT_437060 [Blastocladiella britannica]
MGQQHSSEPQLSGGSARRHHAHGHTQQHPNGHGHAYPAPSSSDVDDPLVTHPLQRPHRAPSTHTVDRTSAVDISNPTNVAQGIHIEYDPETGRFRGVPTPWLAHFERQMTAGLPTSAPPSIRGPVASSSSSTGGEERMVPFPRSLPPLPGASSPATAATTAPAAPQDDPALVRTRTSSTSSTHAHIGARPLSSVSLTVPSHSHGGNSGSGGVPPRGPISSQSSAMSAHSRERPHHRRTKSSDTPLASPTAASHSVPNGGGIGSSTSSAGAHARARSSNARHDGAASSSSGPGLASGSSLTRSNSGKGRSSTTTSASLTSSSPSLHRPEKSTRRSPSSSSMHHSMTGSITGGGGVAAAGGSSSASVGPPSPTPSSRQLPAAGSNSLSVLRPAGPASAAAAGSPRRGSGASTGASELRRPSDASFGLPSSSSTRRPSTQSTGRGMSRSPAPSTTRTTTLPPPVNLLPPPTAPLPDRPLGPPARPRRASARRSRVLSISPRGSLLSSASVVAALRAAVQQQEHDDVSEVGGSGTSTSAASAALRGANREARRQTGALLLASLEAAGKSAPEAPLRSVSSQHAAAAAVSRTSVMATAASAATATTRPTSIVVLDAPPMPDLSAFANVTIHPALMRFIEEAQRMEREQLAQALAAGGGIAAPPAPPTTGLMELLQAGSLTGSLGSGSATAHELAALVALRVTPATLATALEGMLEPGDPNAAYRDVCPYAEGASGDVYSGKDAVVDGPVAIKIIPRDDPRSTDKIARLPLELQLMRASRHPTIVAFIGAYLTDDSVWLVMEWMDAGSLADFLYADEEEESQEQDGGDGAVVAPTPADIADGDDAKMVHGPFAAAGIAYVTTAIARALEYLHGQRRLHRDVRSDNVLLSRDGAVKLADFGYATDAHGPVCEPAGTPFWMAPEESSAAARAFLRGQQAHECDDDPEEKEPAATPEYYGAGVDVWALGMTVYEMACRDYPYSDLDEVAALTQIAQVGAPAMSDVGRARLGDAGAALLARCAIRDPAERVTAAEMLEDPFLADADPAQGRAELLALMAAALSSSS